MTPALLVSVWLVSSVPLSAELLPEPTLESAPIVQVRATPEVARPLPHYGLSMGVGMLAVPVGLALGAGLGTLSNGLLWSLAPAALSMALLAPSVTTLAAWLIGKTEAPGRYGFWLPWTAATLANVLALVVAGFAGMSVGMPAQVVAFSVINGAVLGAVSTGTMRIFAR